MEIYEIVKSIGSGNFGQVNLFFSYLSTKF